MIQLLYTLYTLRKVTANELMAHNMVYYIEYRILIYEIISIIYCDFWIKIAILEITILFLVTRGLLLYLHFGFNSMTMDVK